MAQRRKRLRLFTSNDNGVHLQRREIMACQTARHRRRVLRLHGNQGLLLESRNIACESVKQDFSHETRENQTQG